MIQEVYIVKMIRNDSYNEYHEFILGVYDSFELAQEAGFFIENQQPKYKSYIKIYGMNGMPASQEQECKPQYVYYDYLEDELIVIEVSPTTSVFEFTCDDFNLVYLGEL